MAEQSAIIVGAGVVGLACARALRARGVAATVVEQHGAIGRETSSRNSGVVHAGLYYPKGSLKSKLCIRGKRLLYEWCDAHRVAHERCGKLIVATDDAELDALRELARHAADVGVAGLSMLTASELATREPELRGTGALWSETSGIVDQHGLLDSLAKNLRELGGDVAMETRIVGLQTFARQWVVRTTDRHGRQSETTAHVIVNAAGFGAPALATLCGIDISEMGWTLHPNKGSYFSLTSQAPRPNAALVYPLPADAGLGVHLTRDVGGRVRAGPDAEYVGTEQMNFAVDAAKAERFANAVRRYMPAVDTRHLVPDFAGIRPKLAGPGDAVRDFVVADQRAIDGKRAVHLLGIESPGLTAALGIAEHVAALIGVP